jgi:hypothetical protein
MAQHRLKLTIAAGSLIAALTVGASSDARAFTETTLPPVQPQSVPAPQLQTPEAGNGLSIVNPSDGKSGGTELSIPGIGSVGTLPKLDFGLDLLYGSDPAQERVLENENKDVTIKGTIRHRF